MSSSQSLHQQSIDGKDEEEALVLQRKHHSSAPGSTTPTPITGSSRLSRPLAILRSPSLTEEAIHTATSPAASTISVSAATHRRQNTASSFFSNASSFVPVPTVSSFVNTSSSADIAATTNTLRQTTPLPTPRLASKCPLLCVFYAEFDNQVGPKVCFQTPRHFMDHPVTLPLPKVHEILQATFQDILQHQFTGTSADSISSPPPQEEKDTIFDSCSEFIITGLASNIINLSTHQIHVLSRPTMINDAQYYERNALLFSVGFILRRTEDPRPFRPVLSRLAMTFRDMEVESHFLSSPATRGRIQGFLERTLVSLNSSPKWECNLLLSPANVLNIKLFHPPKLPAYPVPDYAVPILLRRDRQVQMYDWDLSINWVSLFIDGILNAKQIATKAEVDMEMVRACLRVLRHHGVIALVDMFFYSNRYEVTDNQNAPGTVFMDSKLLNAAADFIVRRGGRQGTVSEVSPSLHSVSSEQGVAGTGHGSKFSSSPREQHQQPQRRHTGSSSSLARSQQPPASFPPEGREFSVMSNNRVLSLGSGLSQDYPSSWSRRIIEASDSAIKPAIVEFYCACNRHMSVGDVWISLLQLPGSPIEWKKIFSVLDHRRLISFGLVHGIIRRIHRYPVVVATSLTDREHQILEQQGQTQWQQSRTGRKMSATSLGSSTTFLRQGGGGSSADIATSLKVVAKMDGQHCDDELVCTFEKPMDELMELVKNKRVVSIFAPAEHY